MSTVRNAENYPEEIKTRKKNLKKEAVFNKGT